MNSWRLVACSPLHDGFATPQRFVPFLLRMSPPSGRASRVNSSDGNEHSNGSGAVIVAGDIPVPPPPDAIRELADACIRFVERAIGVKLDYQPETLPLLDHYLEQGRATSAGRQELLVVLAHSTGAYFGELVRRRYSSWWRMSGDDPSAWQIELEQVYLAFNPVQIVADGLLRGGDEEADDIARFELEEADREALAARLAELPNVSDAEFYSLSTRLEVIDIAVDAIRARRMAVGEGDAVLRPEDYERD